jgi:hypothetical protein
VSEHQSAEEVKAQHVADMGVTLGGQFDRLYNECLFLRTKWEEYRTLFGDKESRVDLLNAAAGSFFGMVQSIMYEDVILHLCRLTDDPTVGRRNRQTLSVRQLPPLINDVGLQQHIKKLVSDARKSTEFARDWRDRHIAHRDLELATVEGTRPLTDASRILIDAAIEAITDVLRDVETHYCKVPTAYKPLSPLGGAESLLYVLRDGIDVREELYRRLKAGQIDATTSLVREPI